MMRREQKKNVIRLNKDTETYRGPAKGCRRMLHAFIGLRARRCENMEREGKE